jgi:hypothetical protein
MLEVSLAHQDVLVNDMLSVLQGAPAKNIMQLIMKAGNHALQGVLVKSILLMQVAERSVSQDVHVGVILLRDENGCVNLR